MSVKYSYDKANNVYYLRKHGKKIASASTEEHGFVNTIYCFSKTNYDSS
jgi:hypothetical protein